MNPKLLKPLIIVAACLVVVIIAASIFAVVSMSPKNKENSSSNASTAAPSATYTSVVSSESSQKENSAANSSSQNSTVSSRPTQSTPSKTTTTSGNNTTSSKPQYSISVNQKPVQSEESSSNASSEKVTYIDYKFKKLENTYYHLTKDKILKIAFIGGSVTDGTGADNPSTDSWTRKICDKLKAEYGASVIEEKQSIGGTGSYFGAFRYAHDVGRTNPDLLFVECAINDCYKKDSYDQVVKSSESIVRQAYARNPKIDIVYVLTFDEHRKDADYEQLRAHKDVAKKYGLLCINLRELLGPSIEFGAYYSDDVHPNTEGYALYASTIYDELMKYMPRKRAGIAKAKLKERTSFPEPLSDYYKNPTLVPSNEMDLPASTKWEFKSDAFSYIGKKYGGFVSANEDGAKLTINFKGNEFALVYNAAPTMGTVLVSVDGGAPITLDAHRDYSNPAPLKIPVSGNKEHTVTITLKGDKEFQIAAYTYN